MSEEVKKEMTPAELAEKKKAQQIQRTNLIFNI